MHSDPLAGRRESILGRMTALGFFLNVVMDLQGNDMRQLIRSVIKDLAVEGWTLVIVTHEIQFARQVSQQVLFTDKGVILEQGPPAQVIGDPKEERTRQFLQRILNPL